MGNQKKAFVELSHEEIRKLTHEESDAYWEEYHKDREDRKIGTMSGLSHEQRTTIFKTIEALVDFFEYFDHSYDTTAEIVRKLDTARWQMINQFPERQ